MAKFVLAPCVEDELWALWSFIAQDNPDAADRVIDAAYDTFKNLADNPGLGRAQKFKNSRLKDIRSWRVSGFDNYLIFYHPIPDGVHVLHIYQGARDIDALFEEK